MTITIGLTYALISKSPTSPLAMLANGTNPEQQNHLTPYTLYQYQTSMVTVLLWISSGPANKGYNCILSMTDRLGSDVWIIPTQTDATAEDTTLLVFDNWYCENGLLLDWVSDRDKLFMSCLWKALTKLTGVKLKMLSAYHPQTDNASKWTNKTIIQSICFHVQCNQKGWVWALPHIQFCMVNTINASMGYSSFHLHLGHSPHLIPPIIPTALLTELHSTGSSAEAIISKIQNNVADTKDNLLLMKLTQAAMANSKCGEEIQYKVGNKVMLSTFHRHHKYKVKGDGQVVKFFPRWDGPHTIVDTHPKSLSYSLDNDSTYPYYASQLKPYHSNDPTLFPNHELAKPGPMLTPEDLQEHIINWILDTWECGHGYQYLVCWVGFRAEDNEWLSCKDVKVSKALD